MRFKRLDYRAVLRAVVVFMAASLFSCQRAASQIDPQDGKTILEGTIKERSRVARQKADFLRLCQKPYFSNSLEADLVRDNFTNISNLLGESSSSVYSFRYVFAAKALLAAQTLTTKTDEMLKEDSKSSTTSLQKSVRDDYVVPVPELPRASGLELRTLLDNELALTQRLVTSLGLYEASPGELRLEALGPPDASESGAWIDCAKATRNFHKQIGWPLQLVPEASAQLHSLQYDSVQRTVWRLYSGAQSVAAACRAG